MSESPSPSPNTAAKPALKVNVVVGGGPVVNVQAQAQAVAPPPPPAVDVPLTLVPNAPLAAVLYWAVVLLAYCALVFGYDLAGGGQLYQTDCWVAQTARETQASGQWAVPLFSGELRLNKFPLPYWQLMAVSEWTHYPIDSWLARLFGALLSLGIVFVLYLLALRAAGLRVAVFTGFAVASSAFLMEASHRAASDIQVSFWCLAALGCIFVAMRARRHGWWMALAYICAGIGMLSKGPVPLFVIGAPAIVYMIVLWLLPSWLGRDDLPKTAGKRFVELLKRLHLLWGIPLFLLVWLPWIVALINGVAHIEHRTELALPADHLPYVSLAWKNAAKDVWARFHAEFFDRAAGSLANIVEERLWPWWAHALFYWPFMLFYSLPWTLSFIPALIWPLLPRNRSQRDWLIFGLLYFGATIAFMSISHGKEGRYSAWLLPPVFILLGHHLAWLFDDARPGNRKLTRFACWTAGILLPVGLLIGWLWIQDTALTSVTSHFPKLRFPHSSDLFDDRTALLRNFTILAGVLAAGLIAAAAAFNYRHRNVSFAIIVATMAGGYLVYRPTMDAVVRSRDQAAIYEFADELARQVRVDRAAGSQPADGLFQPAYQLVATSQPVRLYAADNRDARVVWATGIPLLRAAKQLDLDRQPGGRSLLNDQRSGVRLAMQKLRDPEPTLLITQVDPLKYDKNGRPNAKDGFLMRLLAEELATMPAPYVWVRKVWGRGENQYSMTIIGNFPPPGSDPATAERVTLQSLNVGNPTTLPTEEDVAAKLQEKGLDVKKLQMKQDD